MKLCKITKTWNCANPLNRLKVSSKITKTWNCANPLYRFDVFDVSVIIHLLFKFSFTDTADVNLYMFQVGSQ